MTLLLGTVFGASAVAIVLSLISIGTKGVDPARVGLLFIGGIMASLGYQTFRWNVTTRQALSESRTNAELSQIQIEQQRSIVDSLADGLDTAIFVCDLKANILYSNRRANELFRFDAPRGKSIVAVTLSYDLEQLVLSTARERATESDELTFTYPSEIVGRAKAWVSNSTPDRVYLSIYEITDLRRLERIRRDFVANVSHELRTPLTLIRAMAETLEDDDDNVSRRQTYLGRIVSEVDRLSVITQDLLELSMAESNAVRKHECDIVAIVSSVVQQLQGKAVGKNLTIEFRSPEHLMIQANPSQMSQVALNLIDNAINYTTVGLVEVSIERNDRDVFIIVKDTGLGIASDHIGRVFERFYRVDKARSRSSGGTGLGLSIVKHIVEAHGGSVQVDSTLNVGSTFRVLLPID